MCQLLPLCFAAGSDVDPLSTHLGNRQERSEGVESFAVESAGTVGGPRSAKSKFGLRHSILRLVSGSVASIFFGFLLFCNARAKNRNATSE